MPAVIRTLEEIDNSINRPVIFDIIQQIKEITQIKNENAIFYPGDLETNKQPGSSIDDNSRSPLLISGRYLSIEVEQEYDTDYISSTATYRKEYLPFFYDPALDVELKVIYAIVKTVIKFSYRTNSKTEATRWYDAMRLRIAQYMNAHLHSVSYHIPIPMSYVWLLDQIYELRENQGGYGQTFEQYVKSNMSDKISLVSDLTGKNRLLAIKERQGFIEGQYTFDALPDKIEIDKDTGTYQIGFEYSFNYDKPFQCYMRYPIMVHNQLLPEEFVDIHKLDYDTDRKINQFPVSFGAMQLYRTDLDPYITAHPFNYLVIPPFDEFRINKDIPGTGTVFTALCSVLENDKRDILNLEELGDLCLDEDILDFIKTSEYRYITQPYKSIIQLHLYENETPIDQKILICDSHLNIRSTVDLDIRKTFRLRLSLMIDLSYLDTASLNRLKLYPRAFVKIIEAANESLINHPELNDIYHKNVLQERDFQQIYQYLTSKATSSRDRAQFNTVEVLFIIALKKNDPALFDPQQV